MTAPRSASARPAVLVTGATGFVGATLCEALARAGHEVDAFARSTADRSVLAGTPVRWRDGDLRDPEALERAVAATCARAERPWIVHAGAVISYRGKDRELQRSVNVGGTRNVLAACRRHAVGRVLHVSSVVTVGHARPDELLDEESSFNGAELRCDYVDTKRAAEELALAAAEELDLVVVNPGAIFGPGGGSREPNTIRFLRKLAAGPTPPFTPPGSMSVVGVDDVAAGCRLALERGARGRRYLLAESVWTSLDSFRLAADLLGRPRPRRAAPRGLWRTLELAAAAAEPLVPDALLTPQTVRMLGAHFRVRSDRARAELGWSPSSFADVLRDTIERTGLRR